MSDGKQGDNIIQSFLFDDLPTEHDIHWAGMPEFIQDKQEPYSKIIIRFRSEKDLQEFAELVDQALTAKTQSMWYPELVRGIHSNKVYTDES